jgi:hypothetical protein
MMFEGYPVLKTLIAFLHPVNSKSKSQCLQLPGGANSAGLNLTPWSQQGTEKWNSSWTHRDPKSNNHIE